jgi:hypothetical protein
VNTLAIATASHKAGTASRRNTEKRIGTFVGNGRMGSEDMKVTTGVLLDVTRY